VPKTWLQTKRCWIASSDREARSCDCTGGTLRHSRSAATSRWRRSNAVSQSCADQPGGRPFGMNTKSRTLSRHRSNCSVHCEMPIARFTLASRRPCGLWVSMRASLRTVRQSDRPTVRPHASRSPPAAKSSYKGGSSSAPPRRGGGTRSCSTVRSSWMDLRNAWREVREKPRSPLCLGGLYHLR